MRLGGQLQFVAFSEMKHAPSKMGEQRSKPPSWCVCMYIYIRVCVCTKMGYDRCWVFGTFRISMIFSEILRNLTAQKPMRPS